MTYGMFLKTFATVSALAMAGAASAATLYSQPYDGTGVLTASQNDTTGGNGAFATTYDNFTIAATSSVTGLTFTGGYFNGAQAAISKFTVKFYADTANAPGATLATTSIAGNGGESGCVANVCNYSVALNSFAATGGTKYWMSIVPDIGFPPQWGWASGTGGDKVAFQDFLGTRSRLVQDQAFTLTGTAAPGVPEPASWATMLLGMGIVGRALRQRRRTTVSFA